jgi:hypothetical protein
MTKQRLDASRLPHGPAPSALSKLASVLQVAAWFTCCRCVCLRAAARLLTCGGCRRGAGEPSATNVAGKAVHLGLNSRATQADAAPRRPTITRKVLVLGLSGGGKSSLVRALSRMAAAGGPPASSRALVGGAADRAFPRVDGAADDGDLDCARPTKGFAMEEVPYSLFRFAFLEVGGVFLKYWGKYTAGVHGLVYVVDGGGGGGGGGEDGALDDAAKALEEFLVGNAEARGWPVAVLVSKADCSRQPTAAGHTKACEEALARRPLLAALGKGDRRIFAVASFSSQTYSAVKAETDLRAAMDWFVAALLSAAAKAM